MIFISYNLPDYAKLIQLSKYYPNIEIRQDLCNFNLRELKLLSNAITNAILTTKGNYNSIIEIINYGLNSKFKLIDYDYNWGYEHYSKLITEDSLNSKFIISNHIDNKEITYDYIKSYINEVATWKSRFIKIVIENVDDIDTYNRLSQIISLNNERVSLFFTGKSAKNSRVEAFSKGCQLNYAAIGNKIRVNDSQLDLSEYLSICIN